MEQTKLQRFKRIILTSLFTVLFIFIMTISIGFYQSCCAKTNTIEHIDSIQQIGTEQLVVIDTVKIQENIKEELVQEVTKYMNTKTNKYHQFIPKYLVYAGLKYNIDICFMMAQTQLETCYGTLGAGRESSRKSLFGVAVQRYSNYEEAIDKYCNLIQTKYLGQHKNEQHLLVKYVTLKGGRYAENPNYEKELRVVYNHIKNNTNIYQLQQEYKNMNTDV